MWLLPMWVLTVSQRCNWGFRYSGIRRSVTSQKTEILTIKFSRIAPVLSQIDSYCCACITWTVFFFFGGGGLTQWRVLLRFVLEAWQLLERWWPEGTVTSSCRHVLVFFFFFVIWFQSRESFSLLLRPHLKLLAAEWTPAVSIFEEQRQ
jgi:hypothetical protein